ncbi:MAG: TIGR01906 family membrane protein [Clostridium sp.]
MLMKKGNVTSRVINIISGICVSLFSIGFSVILVLNLTPVYKWAIDKYNLVKYTGVSAEDLMINYKGMINYLGNPFIKELKFKDFEMSIQGKIHFEEVKNIFMNLYIMMIIALVIFITLKIVKKFSREMNIIKSLNYCANFTILLFGIIAAMIVIDFSKAFVMFHNLFFNNSYWIFDPNTDPIIEALPEDLFMVYAIIIIVILVVESIAFKVAYYNNKQINIIQRLNQ